MRGWVMVLALAVLAGCTTVDHMYAAPGEKQFVVTCGTAFPEKCRERAEKECGSRDFQVIGQRRGLEGLEMIFRC